MEIIRSKSPLRVSFGGGGTDFPHFFNEHGGAVLSTTINKFAHVTLYPRNDDQIIIRSADLGQEIKFIAGTTPKLDGILDLAKATVLRLKSKKGMTLDIRSEVPPGSGLGGSSSVVSAIIGAVSKYNGIELTKYEQSELNHKIERIDAKIPGGKQDQFATNFGGFNFIEFYKDRTVVNQLKIDDNIKNDLNAHLLFCYTGKVRTNLSLIDKQIQYYKDNRLETIDGVKQMKKLTYQIKEHLLFGEIDKVGLLMDQMYTNKKRMNPDVATGTIADELYERSKQLGVLGGKLCGAGGGGYLLLYCPSKKQGKVRSALEKIGGHFDDITFDEKGLQVWRSKWK